MASPMRSSPALQSTSAVSAVLDSPSDTHGRPAQRPRCLVELACPGSAADVNSSLGRNPGLLFGSAHDLHRHKREKWVRRNVLGVNPLPFQAGEPAGTGGQAGPCLGPSGERNGQEEVGLSLQCRRSGCGPTPAALAPLGNAGLLSRGWAQQSVVY